MRLVNLLSAIALLLPLSLAAAPGQGGGNMLATVAGGSQAYSDMQALAKAGVVQGDFGGQSALTRYDFALALARMDKAKAAQLGPDDTASLERVQGEFGPEMERLNARVQSAEQTAALTDEETQRLEDEVEELNKQIRANTFSGGKVPEITSILEGKWQDITGYGLAAKHGTAVVYKLTLSMNAKLSDGSSVIFDFAPGVSPGLLGSYQDDNDAIAQGPSGSRNSIFASMKIGYVNADQSTAITAGSMFMHTSVLTLSGKLSDRPVLFERSPYAGNQSTKSAFENQFLSGIPKRAPEESEHPIMGGLVRNTWVPKYYSFEREKWIPMVRNQPNLLQSMVFVSTNEGYYDPPYTGQHEYGGTLKLEYAWDAKKDYVTSVMPIGYYRGNERSELDQIGTPGYHYTCGLQSNSLYGGVLTQHAGLVDGEIEAARSNWRKYDGVTYDYWGTAVRGALGVDLRTVKVQVDGYSIQPEYMVNAGGSALMSADLLTPRPYTAVGSRSNTQANGLNDLSWRQTADGAGIIQDTVVSDPTLPMVNTNTYGLKTQFNFFHTFVALRLQNSIQQEPTSAVIVSSHFTNGQNLDGGGWFSFMSNNYNKWDPETSQNNFSKQLDRYNRSTYGFDSTTTTVTQLEPGHFQDPARILVTVDKDITPLKSAPVVSQSYDKATDAVAPTLKYDMAYRQLESFQWRTQQEYILTSDPVTGRALDPSKKSISYAAMDARVRLNEMLGMDQDFFLQMYQDLTTVNDATLVVPSTSPDNLFVQAVSSGTLVYNMVPSVNLLLNAGYESWKTDRIYGPYKLEYHERQAGAGVDWDVYPGRLSLYTRIKVFYHYDSNNNGNDFIGRQMWWELKSFF